jgi:hypothetical protein
MLAGVNGVGRWKGIAFACNLCLRGKVGQVGGRTLMVLKMDSPVVVLTQNRLRVAPGSRRGLRSRRHDGEGAYLGFDLSLCFEL